MDASVCSAGVRCPANKTAATVVAGCDLICLRLCFELSQAESSHDGTN
jgi:hypothetical protein